MNLKKEFETAEKNFLREKRFLSSIQFDIHNIIVALWEEILKYIASHSEGTISIDKNFKIEEYNNKLLADTFHLIFSYNANYSFKIKAQKKEYKIKEIEAGKKLLEKLINDKNEFLKSKKYNELRKTMLQKHKKWLESMEPIETLVKNERYFIILSNLFEINPEKYLSEYHDLLDIKIHELEKEEKEKGKSEKNNLLKYKIIRKSISKEKEKEKEKEK